MTNHQMKKAVAAVKAGQKAQARQLLKRVLQEEPSADAWFLAANAMETEEQIVACLKKALALDEWHTGANRMLSQLEAIDSAEDRGYSLDTGFKSEYEAVTRRAAADRGSFLGNLIGGFFNGKAKDADATE